MAWWHSQNETRWEGPFDSREEAIAEGRGQYGGEGFLIREATLAEYDFDIDLDMYWESFDARNEEKADPDGDGPSATLALTAGQEADLENRINRAIGAWLDYHSINRTAFAFEQEGPIEPIEGSEEE